MKRSIPKVVIGLFFILAGFQSVGQEVKKLSPTDFESGIKSKEIQLVDVRTPEEYGDKRLKNALNMNVKSKEFETQLASLDKNKPVYVYCLAGPRSTAAAEKMKESGFKEVYELEGGITKWIANGKPVEKLKVSSGKAISVKELKELTSGNKLVIIDFNAKWCGPCRKMKPFLDKAEREKGDVVSILPVDADVNEELVQHFRIDALPTLILFKNSKQLLRHEGYLDQEGVDALIEKYK